MESWPNLKAENMSGLGSGGSVRGGLSALGCQLRAFILCYSGVCKNKSPLH